MNISVEKIQILEIQSFRPEVRYKLENWHAAKHFCYCLVLPIYKMDQSTSNLHSFKDILPFVKCNTIFGMDALLTIPYLKLHSLNVYLSLDVYLRVDRYQYGLIEVETGNR